MDKLIFCKNCNKWVAKTECVFIGKMEGDNFDAHLYNHVCQGTIAEKVYFEPKNIDESMAAQADLCDDIINFKR